MICKNLAYAFYSKTMNVRDFSCIRNIKVNILGFNLVTWPLTSNAPDDPKRSSMNNFDHNISCLFQSIILTLHRFVGQAKCKNWLDSESNHLMLIRLISLTSTFSSDLGISWTVLLIWTKLGIHTWSMSLSTWLDFGNKIWILMT